MAMDPAWVIDRLESNASVFQGLVRLVRSPQAIWKPSADKWSMLEVMNHLGDEETDDFWIRLRLVLEDAARQWPPIVENQFNKLDLLCSWLLHDLIHIRQINRLHYEYHANMSPEFSGAYGGTW